MIEASREIYTKGSHDGSSDEQECSITYKSGEQTITIVSDTGSDLVFDATNFMATISVLDQAMRIKE